MNKLAIKSFFTKYWPIILLITIAIVSHIAWLTPDSIITFADWSHWSHTALLEAHKGWSTWLSYEEFGRPNIQVAFYPFILIWSLIGNLGGSYDLAVKITFMIPIIILGFLAPYMLAISIFKNKLIGFTLALFYGTTTYFLDRQSAHLNIAITYALAPLLILMLKSAFESKLFSRWISFFLLYWLSSIYELRITLIITVILIIYILCLFY
jgi:hypothetical protein